MLMLISVYACSLAPASASLLCTIITLLSYSDKLAVKVYVVNIQIRGSSCVSRHFFFSFWESGWFHETEHCSSIHRHTDT